MANPEHLAKLNEGAKAWNRWRKENFGVAPDLGRANLREADLAGANLRGADLVEANLLGANLGWANLRGADLRRANLLEADLRWANLLEANLLRAYLGGANLLEANLLGADLRRANLLEAKVGFTAFANVDLSETRGLETVIHDGPSTVGIDTIFKSKGKIPPVFLRGCGVPENFIAYMASLVGAGIEFYSLFISHSTQDKEFAERLHNDLQANGVRCWYAPHDLRSGRKVYRQIDEAVRAYDKLLLILSPASMASEWVRTEIAIARKREVEQKREVLFPIGLCPFQTIRIWEYFDSDIGKDSAREIREFHIPDFSNWKDHDDYKLAFDRLLRDLQGEPKPASA